MVRFKPEPGQYIKHIANRQKDTSNIDVSALMLRTKIKTYMDLDLTGSNGNDFNIQVEQSLGSF